MKPLDTLGLDCAIDLLDEQLLAAEATEAANAETVAADLNATVSLIRTKWTSIDASGFPHHADDAMHTEVTARSALNQRKERLAKVGIDIAA